MWWSSNRIGPRRLALVTFAGFLVADVASKHWAQAALTEPVLLTSWFYLAVHRNQGLFLGHLPVSKVSYAHWVFISAVGAWIVWRMLRARNVTISVGYAMVAAGLAGNVLGRAQGSVVDFLALGPIVGDKWLFANLADIALLSGVILIGVVLVRSRVLARARRSD